MSEPRDPAQPADETDDSPVVNSKDGNSDDNGETAEPEWWEDPRMPWKGKPSKADIACWVGFSLTGIYSLVLLPLRPVLLAANPYVLAALGGSRTSTVTIGALAAVGQGHVLLGLLLSTFGTMKFDWLFWWAGKLWGRGLVEMVAGHSARSARNAERAERLAKKYGAAAILLTYVVPLLPGAVVYASVAIAGMRLRTFLAIDIAGAVLTRALYLYLGYRIGQPAVDVVEVIAKYSLWISLVLLAGVIVNAVRQGRRRAAGQGSETPPAP